jgi:hypothetical protein
MSLPLYFTMSKDLHDVRVQVFVDRLPGLPGLPSPSPSPVPVIYLTRKG